MAKFLDIEGLKTFWNKIKAQIKKEVPFTLRFSSRYEKNLNNLTDGATIYALAGNYKNAPTTSRIEGSLINLVWDRTNVYDNIEDVDFIYQFILSADGRIFNRTRWASSWTDWQQIQRV